MRRLDKGPVPIETALPEKIRQLNRSVTRAIDLTKVISDYTKLDADFKPESVNVAEMVDSVRKDYESVLSGAHVQFRASGGSDTAVLISHGHFRIILSNLIQNAIDALQNHDNAAITIAWEATDTAITLSVGDNGEGIPEQDLERVFDAFFTTKPRSGTGLGLPTVRQIVTMYDGGVSIRSREGEGTTVTLRFTPGDPLPPATPRKKEQATDL
jgi:signal transduction histidine kinase